MSNATDTTTDTTMCECGQHKRMTERDRTWIDNHAYDYAWQTGATHDSANAYAAYVVREVWAVRCYGYWNHSRRYLEWADNYTDPTTGDLLA